jgi:hypothetical protein
VHDEFRVEVDIEPGSGRKLLRVLEAVELPEDARRDLGRLAVSHERDNVFLYADSLAAASQARSVVEREIARLTLPGAVSLWRWHPLEERWEDASVALPASEEERAAERERLAQDETAESAAAGYPEWEVRVTLPTHGEAREFAERLEGEGIPVQRRWRHVMAGAVDEEQARVLAERLGGEAPLGSEVHVEGSGLPFWKMLHGPAQPFAVFGGLAQ